MRWLRAGADRWRKDDTSKWSYTLWGCVGRFWVQVEFGLNTKEYAAEMAALKEA